MFISFKQKRAMIKLARKLGYPRVDSLLQKTLEEEKKAAEMLPGIAEKGLNRRALEETND